VFSALANLINRRPWRVLAVAVIITAIAAPLGIHVRDYLKPRGFDVPGSGSAKARAIIAQAAGTDPANSVLALVHVEEPLTSPSSLRTIGAVETRLRRDPAVTAVLDWRTARNPAMVSRDGRSTYVIAALRPLNDEQQEEAGKRLLAAFDDEPQVTLGGNPIANEEISTTIENDLRRAELLALPLIVLLSFFLFRGFVASLLAPLAGGITVIVPNGGTPFYIALKAPPTEAGAAAAAALAERAQQLPGVRAVARPQPLHNAWQINLIAEERPYSATTQTLVRKLRSLESVQPFFVGGDAAAFDDEREAIAARLPVAIVLLALATFFILFLLSGSLVAPLLALLMNALTLAAAFGALILIFQDGRFQSLLSYTGEGALDLTIPLVLAALVFAISTDYGVFLLSRVREARLQGQTDREAISGSVATVGRIVTSAAILFAVSIGVFGTSDIIVLKILGLGTALAVLLDALFVRCLLLPASLTLLRQQAWWLPSSLARLHERIGLHEASASGESAPRVAGAATGARPLPRGP
jgi:uncharacterized membrane protein YdfJ with MMPL/SSD domain